jgi:hypothetical protein
MISDRLWRQWFAGDHAVIGRTLAVNAQSFTVAGVAPRGFRGLAPVILMVGVAAALRPALRAAQVDPNVALREL